MGWPIFLKLTMANLQFLGSKHLDNTTKLQYSKQCIICTKTDIDQWNRIESPEINPHTYCQLIFNKWGKNIQWGKHSLFSKWCWESWTATCKLMKLEHTLIPCTETNSKWHDTIKLLEGNIGRILFDINHSNIFLDLSPTVMEIKAKIQMWPN